MIPDFVWIDLLLSVVGGCAAGVLILFCQAYVRLWVMELQGRREAAKYGSRR